MLKIVDYGDAYMPILLLVLFAFLGKAVYRKEKVIFVYCLVCAILFTISDSLSIQRKMNLPFYHLASLVELWIVSYYFIYKITLKKFPVVFWIINIPYLCFFVANIFFWEKLTDFNSNTAGVGSLIILFLSMYYILKLSKSDEILYFQRLPSFWIASGFLIYNAVSVLVLLSYKYFIYVHLIDEGNSLWVVLSAANIIKFALISIGLLCHRKQPATHLPFLL